MFTILKDPKNPEPGHNNKFAITDKEWIYRSFDKGTWLCEVSIPDDQDLEFDEHFKKIYVDKIVVLNSYSLFNPDTYNVIDKTIWCNGHIVRLACQMGNIDFIKWYSENDPNIELMEDFILMKSIEYGQQELTDWCKANFKMITDKN
jgi:hypothetical protein